MSSTVHEVSSYAKYEVINTWRQVMSLHLSRVTDNMRKFKVFCFNRLRFVRAGVLNWCYSYPSVDWWPKSGVRDRFIIRICGI